MSYTVEDLYTKFYGEILEAFYLPPPGAMKDQKRSFPNRETVHATILGECGQFETVFCSVEAMEEQVHAWSLSQYGKWFELWKTMNQKYELTHNYDRTETETLDTADTENRTHSNRDTSQTSTTTNATTKRAAFNSTDTRTAAQDNGSDTENGTVEGSGSENVTGSRKTTRTVRAFGNIGVTTAQQMIQEERKLLEFDLCKYIADGFKDKFCIMIY